MRLEPRDHRTAAVLIGYPVAALAVAVVISSLLVMLSGASPFSVLGLIVKGAAGTQFAGIDA